ncbi:hypothetical protein PN462_11060 [Spirulina sp. CS-785/01]|uniref:hypothetical protein n=1 Tax=Spirulina sp. CS-785/01 TaxID=3021716 RepID=UPI00232B4D36|nr:hypothetical protein [Spirulina sp. CS-785/01]MDB9313639.1 hypothetical protein [Spirulina sp. CS-785/01]
MVIRGWLNSLTSKQRTSPPEARYLYLNRNIRLLLERHNSHQSYLQAIHFYLNPETLDAIQQAKESEQRLYIPKKFLSVLRYYLFFAERNSLTLGLNVLSYYEQNQAVKPLVRSLISFDGDIVYQIDQTCLEDEALAQSLTISHYWLIEQLLTALRLAWTDWFKKLAWIPYLLILGGVIVWDIHALQKGEFPLWQIIASFLYSILGKPILAWLLQQLFVLLRRWFFRKILFGGWSQQYQFKQKLLNWLSRLGV